MWCMLDAELDTEFPELVENLLGSSLETLQIPLKEAEASITRDHQIYKARKATRQKARVAAAARAREDILDDELEKIDALCFLVDQGDINSCSEILRQYALPGQERLDMQPIAVRFGMQMALKTACRLGCTDIVRELVGWGADVNAPSMRCEEELPPLHTCAHCGHLSSIQLLLEHGACPERICGDGMRLLHVAVTKPDSELLELLLNAGANVDAATEDVYCLSPLLLAAKQMASEDDPSALESKLSIIRMLIARGADVNATGRCGVTALLFAAGSCTRGACVELIKELISAGADPNAAAADGVTPLVIACYAAIMSPYALDADDRAAFMQLFSPADQLDAGMLAVETLLQAGAKDVPTSLGVTALMIAADGGCSMLVKLLLDAGHDPLTGRFLGKTALQWADPSENQHVHKLLSRASRRTQTRLCGGDVSLSMTEAERVKAVQAAEAAAAELLALEAAEAVSVARNCSRRSRRRRGNNTSAQEPPSIAPSARGQAQGSTTPQVEETTTLPSHSKRAAKRAAQKARRAFAGAEPVRKDNIASFGSDAVQQGQIYASDVIAQCTFEHDESIVNIGSNESCEDGMWHIKGETEKVCQKSQRAKQEQQSESGDGQDAYIANCRDACAVASPSSSMEVACSPRGTALARLSPSFSTASNSHDVVSRGTMEVQYSPDYSLPEGQCAVQGLQMCHTSMEQPEEDVIGEACRRPAEVRDSGSVLHRSRSSSIHSIASVDLSNISEYSFDSSAFSSASDASTVKMDRPSLTATRAAREWMAERWPHLEASKAAAAHLQRSVRAMLSRRAACRSIEECPDLPGWMLSKRRSQGCDDGAKSSFVQVGTWGRTMEAGPWMVLQKDECGRDTTDLEDCPRSAPQYDSFGLKQAAGPSLTLIPVQDACQWTHIPDATLPSGHRAAGNHSGMR